MIVVAILFAVVLIYLIMSGIYKGIICEEIPGSYGHRLLHGDEARRYGWVLVVLGILGLVVLTIVVMITWR